MGLYNFHKRFAPFILAGKKTHTIRSLRAHPDKPGNTIHCYTGLRQKGTKLLGRFVCAKVEDIRIEMGLLSKNGIQARGVFEPQICINDHWLDDYEKDALARRDGFKDFADMMAFWEGRLPFHGHIIHWRRK